MDKAYPQGVLDETVPLFYGGTAYHTRYADRGARRMKPPDRPFPPVRGGNHIKDEAINTVAAS